MPPIEDDEVSLRDTLVAAFEEDAGDKAAPKSEPKTPAEEPAKSPAVDPKDAPKDPAAKTPESEAAAADKEKTERRSRYREPPSRWSKEAKEEWAKAFGAIDPENPTHKQIGALRDMMADRHQELEAQATTAAKEASEVKARYETLDKVLTPYRAAVEASGQTVERALGELLQLNTYATNNPVEFVKWFTQARGLDPKAIFGLAASAPANGNNAPSEPTDDDPLGIIPQSYKDAVSQVPKLLQRIEQLETGTGRVLPTVQRFMEEQSSAKSQAAMQTIQQWQTAKDEAGNPLRPHYDSVREDMILLMEQGRAANLDEAYEKACRLNGTVWQQMQDSIAARKAAEIEAQARERAARARSAASSLTGRAGAAPPVAPAAGDRPVSLRDTLYAAFEGNDRAV